jgi:predicted Fe-Mo cluster-binding NifX family protein
MLIVIGADGATMNSQVAKRFGHANYYLIYNSETKEVESVGNSQTEHKHNNLSQFVEIGVKGFIVGNIGPYAFNIVNTETSKVYLARKMSAIEAVNKLITGELALLSEPTAKKSIDHDHH